EDLSGLVEACRLETDFHLPDYVIHRRFRREDEDAKTSSHPLSEIWDIKEHIGEGGSGFVRREERRVVSEDDWILNSAPMVRAVKQMRKIRQNGQVWNYRAEIEAVVRFSQPKYGLQFSPHFVRTFGWFEDPASIFLAMEYVPDGDLERFKNTAPPFSELDASQIVWQLIRGVSFMHDNGFAHRDLKPGNILISSTFPRWQVKIADFGISKQAMQGVTRLETMTVFGTWGYMAPEVLGHNGGNDDNHDQSIAYTMSVDIWAVGVIAMSLLVKRDIFRLPFDLWRYVRENQALDFTRQGPGPAVTDHCRNFITGLLSPDPVLRPTAVAALAHPWLAPAIPPPPGEIEIPDSEEEPVSPPTLPSAPWDAYTPDRDVKPNVKGPRVKVKYPDSLITKFKALHLDSILLSKRFHGVVFDTTRFYVLRSDNATDIETSAAHSVWTSSQRVNKMLDKGFKASMGRVVLFFSVILSRRFCGVARMTSALDWNNTDPHWLEDVWEGRFTLTWLSHSELSFDLVKHVPVKETTPNFRAIACYDGTEISPGSAFELLRVYSAEERRQQ
ncbi:putative serine/threonine-protein kinase, partial [Podospora australis]